MMHVAWPWMALCLPLPWLLARWLPPVRPDGAALFVPFAATVAAQGTLSANAIPRWRLVLFVLVWLALVAAAMRPQWLGAPEPVPTPGRRLLLAVDVSGSMAAPAMDGGYSRLQVAQDIAGDFICSRPGDTVGQLGRGQCSGRGWPY